jgi:catechol 2,3-dioxygenase-like lactoylglutathione lyase family enzyme
MRGELVGAAFDHVGISVSDLPAATDWWCRALGLTVEYRVEPPGTDLTGVMLIHPSGLRVELLHRPGALAFPAPSGPVEAAGRRGYGHLCLRVGDVAAAFAALVDAGATPRKPPAPSPARPGATTAFVADPDGNLVELLDRSPMS